MIKNILFVILIYCLSLQVKAQTTDCGSHIVFLLDGSSSFQAANKISVKNAIVDFITETQDNDVFVSVLPLTSDFSGVIYPNPLSLPNDGFNYVLYSNDSTDFNTFFNNYINNTQSSGAYTDYWTPGLNFIHTNLVGNTSFRDPDMVILFGDEAPGPYSATGGPLAATAGQNLINDGVNLFYMLLDNYTSNGTLGTTYYAQLYVPSGTTPSGTTEDTVPNFSTFPSYFLAENFSNMQIILENLKPILIEQGLICGDCDDCYSFQPFAGEKYVLDAWIKEEQLTQQTDYTHSQVKLLFLDEDEVELPSSTLTFTPKGNIIDGWQRVHDSFTIPSQTVYISIELVNTNEQQGSSYFDDVRIFPYNGNMKSFVYDQKTQKLMSELDENNYATFYEYDKEGGLIRVKKETEKGIMTIQETRSSSTKK